MSESNYECLAPLNRYQFIFANHIVDYPLELLWYLLQQCQCGVIPAFLYALIEWIRVFLTLFSTFLLYLLQDLFKCCWNLNPSQLCSHCHHSLQHYQLSRYRGAGGAAENFGGDSRMLYILLCKAKSADACSLQSLTWNIVLVHISKLSLSLSLTTQASLFQHFVFVSLVSVQIA